MTGFNTAFVINNETKEALIREDPKSTELLTKVVRGRDIGKFSTDWQDSKRWLIATFPSLDISIEDYPAVKKYLISFGKDRLEQAGLTLPDGIKSRKKTKHSWYELQDTCAYHEEFKNEKIIWIELVDSGRFTYDNSGLFCEASCFMLTGECIKYLTALLNSKLTHWFLRQTTPTSGMGVLRWKKIYVNAVPVPRISTVQQTQLVQLIDEILRLKTIDQYVDTNELEDEINRFVFNLYNLNLNEISVIETLVN